MFTASYAVTHPSEPNYLALFSGSTQGVTDDSCPQTFSTENLGHELGVAGLLLRRVLRGHADRRLHRLRQRELRAQAQPVG